MNDHCGEKLRLLVEYRKAVRLYATRLDVIVEMVSGLLPKSEFARLSNATNLAHQRCVDAREYFYTHIKEHGC
jgi:hypothetical protein